MGAAQLLRHLMNDIVSPQPSQSSGSTLLFRSLEPWEVGTLSMFQDGSKADKDRAHLFGSRREKAFDGICSTAPCRVKGLLPSGGGLRMSPSRCFSSAALVLLVYLKQTLPANDGDIWAPPSPTTSRHSLSAWLFPLSPWIRKPQDALFVVPYLKNCDTALWSS